MRTPHKRLSIGVLALVAAGSMVFAAAALAHGRGGHGRHGNDHGDHLITQNLVPSKAGTPAAPAIVIFGINPGGADWFLKRGEAKVRSDGRIKVRVRGLVLASGNAGGVSAVAASLLCNGVPTTGSPTPTSPLSQDGNARIEGQVTLPATCIAPVVVVHPFVGGQLRTNTYIAITGFTLTQNDDND